MTYLNALAMLVVPVAGTTTSARADVFNDIAIALDYAGFNFLGRENINIQGRENLLSGGLDFLGSVNFDGSPLDFGPGSLSLFGPVSVDISTGGRALRTLDISFQTALSGDPAATPLSYLLDVDSGSQTARLNGSILLDADLSVNQFGFYDFTFTYSSRQEVTRAGRFVDDTADRDLDVGPIHLRGNVFADVLGLLTAPLFEAANQPNLFASFSESTRLKEAMQTAALDSLADRSLGALIEGPGRFLVPNDPIRLVDLPGSTQFGVVGTFGADASSAAVVPEPAVLVLLAMGFPALLCCRRRNRPHHV